MSRWRPPAEKSSPYITPDGQRRLQRELDSLWLSRREVVAALSAAAAEGDRSENAEYIYRKKQLREMDRRIRYLQKRLPELHVIERRPDNPAQVFFGATVCLEAEDGSEQRYRIVGADELDPSAGHISIDSPMARALLKKQIDDEVRVTTPQGEKCWWVISVHYD